MHLFLKFNRINRIIYLKVIKFKKLNNHFFKKNKTNKIKMTLSDTSQFIKINN